MKGLFIYRWRHPKNLGVNWIKNKSLEYDEDFKKECGDQEDLSPGGGVLQSVHNTWPCAAQWLQPGVLLQFPAAAAAAGKGLRVQFSWKIRKVHPQY